MDTNIAKNSSSVATKRNKVSGTKAQSKLKPLKQLAAPAHHADGQPDDKVKIDASNFMKAVDPKSVVLTKELNLNNNDMFLVGDLELAKKGLINHHIESMNELYEIGIDQIITRVFKIEKDIVDLKPAISEDEKNIDYVHLEINFSNVTIGKPMMINYNSSKEEILFPNQAIRIEKTYNSTIRVDAAIKETIWMKNGTNLVREGQLKDFNLGKIPIMVGSKLCHTYGLPKHILRDLNEDPTDPGGYFIINGGEWAIDSVESILFNKIRIFKNEGYQKELLHAHFISRPGDFYLNSDEFIIRVLNDGQCTLEISRDQLKGKQFPFYVIFRILGWESDRDIWKNIVMNEQGPLTDAISTELQKAFNAKYPFMAQSRDIYNRKELLYYLAEEMKADFKKYDLSTEEAQIKLTQNILESIDIHFLPHMGFTKERRLNKLRFLGLVMHKLFLTKLGILDPTDRDSYNSKRIHAAGTSYAKIIKTHLNATVIQQVKRAFIRNFKSQSAFTIDLETSLKASIHGIEFGRSITQSITAGNKSQITINKKKRTNRLSSQLLNRRNQLNTYSILRAVTTTSADNAKQSERANEIRRVHMSFFGYVCCVHSPEGEKVGINKQLAIFASITKASFGEVIKSLVLADPECTPLDKITVHDIADAGLCNIFVNGDWIGVCPSAIDFAIKYRKKRRALEISPEITIVWESRENEVYFWTDVGRVIRPLLIVYNNKRDPEFYPAADRYDEKKRNFRQNIALTQKHIDAILARQITIDDLLRDRVIEYISAEEQENMYICSSYLQLHKTHTDELHDYTHCDIEQSQLGITALISPMATHNAVVRTIFLTSQAKQTCSIYALNWVHRADKEGLIQYQSESPLVKTASNRYLFPNGNMMMVAIMCYSGYNQEDSLIVSKGAVERGLFDGSKLTFYKTKLEQREEFASPTHATEKTRVACYDKLVNGIVPIGTIVYKDDALIGKIAKVPSQDKGYVTVDRSVIYKDIEPAIVHDVIVDRNEQDERIAKVVLRKIRQVAVGDKFCVTGEHEVLTNAGWKKINHVTTTDIVATLNPTTRTIEWHNPTDTFEFDHDGPLYHVKARGVDLKTTFNHKMYVRTNSEDYNRVEAYKIFGKKCNYSKCGINTYSDQPYFILPSFTNTGKDGRVYREYPDRQLSMDHWLWFLGIYLAKGTIADIQKDVLISTHKMRVRNKLMEVCDILGFQVHMGNDKNYMQIHNRQLDNYLVQFGKSYDKYIPEWAFSLSARQSKILLDGLLLGDGYHDSKRDSYTLYSGSKQLIDGAQILAFMSGQSANMVIKKQAGETLRIKERLTVRNSNQYALLISSYGPSMEPSVGGRSTTESFPEHTGKVYCIEVPNHIFMIRHNNTYVWTSNSSRAGLTTTAMFWPAKGNQ